MPKAGDLVAGKYEIERMIGEGGMGSVFSAVHKLTGKRVALKWMLPSLARDEGAVQRFMREAQAAGRISHKNVVDVYDVGQHDGSFFLVMELLRGEPLTAALERRDLDVGALLDLLLPAMRGVAAAHRGGVVHRDLKPDNIFLCDDDDGRCTPKVLDFGISKVASQEGELNPRLTKTGAVVGTPYYMCPEQIRGSHEVDKRADVYAFGVILFEALTGKVPFDAETYSALILKIATGDVPEPAAIVPSLPKPLSDIVRKAMARELPDRFQDLESLVAALEPFAGTASGYADRRDPTGSARLPAHSTASVATPFASEIPPAPRSGGNVLFVGAALGVAIALGAWAWLSRSSPDASADAPAHVVTAPAAAAPSPALPAADALGADRAPVVAADAAAQPTPGAPATAPELPAQAEPTQQAVAPAEPEAAADDKPSRSERTRRRREPSARPTPAPAVAPPAAPRPVAAPARGPRSGTISVDDF